MSTLDQLKSLSGTAWNPDFDILGFVSAKDVPSEGFLVTTDKLDLDTDGKKSPSIARYDADHQDQTSIDPNGSWLDSNLIPYVVLPPWLATNKGLKLGNLVTVCFQDKVAHAILADFGPKRKIGEASIAVHRQLGFERVVNNRIQNVGIDGTVVQLFYTGVVLTRPSASDIAAAGAAALSKALSTPPPLPKSPSSDPVLMRGDRGPDVVRLQNLLTNKGFSVPSTGFFGSITAQAVGSFQDQEGLDDDEVVGPITWAALEA